MLHPQVAREIKDIHKRLLEEGKLLSLDRLQEYYATFRQRFHPDTLRSMDGEALLNYVHALDRDDLNSLVYWLEFKNDDEFPTRAFGSIAGGSALKYRVYQNAKTGAWMGRDERNFPVEITLEQAIAIARRNRDELVQGAALVENLAVNASDEEYAALQAEIDQQMPDMRQIAWAHKYLYLLYPNKLDDYHLASLQRFHLVRLLQENLPEESAGRYLNAGWFIRIAQELDMPINHLTTCLNQRSDPRYYHWAVWTSDSHNPVTLNWQIQREGSFAAISFAELGDLSTLKPTREEIRILREQMSQRYPSATYAEVQSVVNFVCGIKVNDVMVAIEPREQRIVGIGRVTGEYYFAPTNPRHRIPVHWQSVEEWRFPEQERFDVPVKEIRRLNNQVEVERRLLESGTRDNSGARTVTHQATNSQNIPAKLTGIPGRIQSILERKGQVILYGPPGTGKTYWAELTACELSARQVFGKAYSALSIEEQGRIFGKPDSHVQLCSFHPAYGYEDFLEGYRPQTTNGHMSFIRQNGIFKRLCDLARENPKQSFFLIIDEINRGDIPRIFGELMTVLEKDKRGKSILLPLSGEGFTVPANVFVIGTMNTADRSIALLDTALRRRFGFIELMPNRSLLGQTVISGIPLGAWLEALNERILRYIGQDARNLQIGHAYFLERGAPISEFGKFARVLRDDIIPLLEEYCYEDYEALQGILGLSLVDDKNQVIRHELFEPGRESELVQALLEPTPDLITLASVTEAAVDSDSDSVEQTEDDEGIN